jgi:hypothetical protein
MLGNPYRITSGTMLTLQIHPIAGEMPAMSDAEYARLRDDIERHGLIQPITIYQGMVLDGRHRLRAANEIGLTSVAAVAYVGDDPEGYSIQQNVMRRHLTATQRAMLAGRRVTSDRGRPAGPSGLSLPAAARMFAVSPRYVTEARALLNDIAALGGTPESASFALDVRDRLLAGTMSFAAARGMLAGRRESTTPEARIRASRPTAIGPHPEATLDPPQTVAIAPAENGPLIDQIAAGSIDAAAWARGLSAEEAGRLLPVLEAFARIAYDTAQEEGLIAADPPRPAAAPRPRRTMRSETPMPF